nr:immunoglobulin light chain junction region [Macaca mulatta]
DYYFYSTDSSGNHGVF